MHLLFLWLTVTMLTQNMTLADSKHHTIDLVIKAFHVKCTLSALTPAVLAPSC